MVDSQVLLGEVAALASAALWAANAILIKPRLATADGIVVNGLRTTFAACFFIPAALVVGVRFPQPFPWAALAFFLASVLVGLGIGDSLYYQSLDRLGVSLAVPISSISPLFTVLLAVILVGEPVTWRLLLAATAIVASVTLLAYRRPRPQEGPLLRQLNTGGVLLALTAAACWAAGTVMLKLGLNAGLDPVSANVIRLPFAAILLMGAVSVRGGATRWPRTSRPLWIATAVAGLIGAISAYIYALAVDLAGPSVTMALSSTTPLFATPFAVLVLREAVTVRIAAGTLLGVAGILLLVLR